MNDESKLAKKDAETRTKIRIEVSGFPTQRAGSKFIEQIVKPEYKRLFEGSNLRVGADGALVFEEFVCCSATGGELQWFICSETMHHCLFLGSGCPV